MRATNKAKEKYGVTMCRNSACEHELRLRNDLYCVGWGVKLYSPTANINSCSFDKNPGNVIALL